MKIGVFAQNHHISVDAVRHYMALSLLLPRKKGSHYIFSEKDSQDLEELLELKTLGFTLTEIQKIFSYKRLTTLKTQEDRNHYKALLNHKRQQLIQQQAELEKKQKCLEEKISAIASTPSPVRSLLGLPLLFLQHLACPDCGSSLTISNGLLEQNMILKGNFTCTCGYYGEISEGIFVSLTEEDKKKIIPTKGGAETLQEYVDMNSPKYISFMYHTIQRSIQLLKTEPLENSIILELGTGSGFFLKQFLNHIPPTAYYIICDHNLERIQIVKDYLEKESGHNQFIFLCADFERLPIASASLDFVIDYWSSAIYNLNNDKLLVSQIADRVKSAGKLIGSYIYMGKKAVLFSNLPKAQWPYYQMEPLQKMLCDSPFRFLLLEELGLIEEFDAPSEPLMVGNQVHAFIYYGKKC
ncbi:MerR family transcriptional regulator [Geosporobacter ferrireducens]|uniref:HTH merR-type domain-containing protein n=1 Tax=Geosporobacter ferrireducens TaxID=1424294 RepID=A0A1D8GD86_9FIRM|nr:MerR family transcriptional regulator [Geosporobacter ferrireducens]AOT68867.1 hypothetical protein Gferi_04430 [Geosporobacter ferrireducens]MTI54900.1 MerR family transcriptional regulator [Geosporobacter ferrireducens]